MNQSSSTEMNAGTVGGRQRKNSKNHHDRDCSGVSLYAVYFFAQILVTQLTFIRAMAKFIKNSGDWNDGPTTTASSSQNKMPEENCQSRYSVESFGLTLCVS